MDATIRRLLPLYLLAGIIAVAVGYYFAIALPAHNKAKLALERDRFAAAEKARTDKERAEKRAADAAQVRYADCEERAEAIYWAYVKLNGRSKPGAPGVYTAAPAVWDNAAKRKKSAIDDCVKGATLPTAEETEINALPSFDTVMKPKK